MHLATLIKQNSKHEPWRLFQKSQIYRVIAEGRKGMRDPTFRMGREEIFFNFPSRMWKGKRFFSISLPTWKKKEFSTRKNRQNRTFRVGREEIFFNFPFPMWEGKRLSSYFPFQRSLCKYKLHPEIWYIERFRYLGAWYFIRCWKYHDFQYIQWKESRRRSGLHGRTKTDFSSHVRKSHYVWRY